ncbi:EP300-interacting inhibitor of differentiation 3 isoform X1 [Hylaeus anthracinus]|uniref:EP300-interacting inhibitor of differentiation 3 isoform X1 n=1 Tax=Hylaeus anthracinus TaxID=313031 RepID=UPI0023B8A848|nr:EP300-interacting inhibitor of differentiation 3 isoform X1 [Hylaeus anthracinus]XP_053997867.1 EP300-interacting inhibitor of differentiation 3 isoform X1 [Hylaeus anthracinus]
MSNNSSNGETRSPQQRKETLRKIITRAASLQETVDDNTIQTLESCMEITDDINSETSLDEKIHNQEEVLLDSEMMNMSSNILKKCTRTLTKNICYYNHIDYAQKVVKYIKQLPDIQSELPDWSLVQTQIVKNIKTTPQYSTLLGALTPLEKQEVNRRKPVVREALAQIKRPQNVDTVDKEEEGIEQTVKIKDFITRYCRTQHKPIDFFKLILHPTDFGKTIENMLQISFLVRDGKLKIAKDDSGILVIQPCTKDMIVQTKATEKPNIQNVISLTMDQWKMLKNIYRLKKPMIDFHSD